jgi:hypothetical protein
VIFIRLYTLGLYIIQISCNCQRAQLGRISDIFSTASPRPCEGYDYVHLSVIKYAIDTKKVGDLDMFKLKNSDIAYFVSSLLKEKLAIHGAKGFNFLKIKSS